MKPQAKYLRFPTTEIWKTVQFAYVDGLTPVNHVFLFRFLASFATFCLGLYHHRSLVIDSNDA